MGTSKCSKTYSPEYCRETARLVLDTGRAIARAGAAPGRSGSVTSTRRGPTGMPILSRYHVPITRSDTPTITAACPNEWP